MHLMCVVQTTKPSLSTVRSLPSSAVCRSSQFRWAVLFCRTHVSNSGHVYQFCAFEYRVDRPRHIRAP